jgi:RNA polymerase sigma-70 factor, ECF subfamily
LDPERLATKLSVPRVETSPRVNRTVPLGPRVISRTPAERSSESLVERQAKVHNDRLADESVYTPVVDIPVVASRLHRDYPHQCHQLQNSGVLMQPTSHTLLDAIKGQPNSPEWDRFVRLYRPLLEAWAIRHGFQPADAEELSQEILMKLLAALPSYTHEDGRSFRSWLFVLARNAGHDFRRRVATRALPAGEGLSGADDGSPLAEMEEQEYRWELVQRTLELVRGEFAEKTMAAFLGSKVQGRPAAEVADELGITPGAVYVAVNRVMTRLREELGELLD